MSKETLVFVLGTLVLFIPFLGLPSDYKKWTLVVVGALLMIAGYLLRRDAFLRSLMHESGEKRADAFVESVQVNTTMTSSAVRDTYIES